MRSDVLYRALQLTVRFSIIIKQFLINIGHEYVAVCEVLSMHDVTCEA